MRRRWGAIAVLTATATALAPTVRATPAVAEPTIGPLVSGTTSVVDGVHVWTDYVYDDTGADTDGNAGGDQRAGNDADLVQVQLRAVDGGLRVTAVLETLVDPAVPAVIVGLDRDHDSTTGGGLVPTGWGADLGLDEVMVLDASSATVDPDANTVEGFVPGVDGGIGVVVAAGVRSGGGIELRDLAYVEEPPPGAGLPLGDSWQDETQAGVLAGRDVHRARAEVDLTSLDGATELARADAPGFHTLLYRSELDLGEGIGQFELHMPGFAAPLGDLYAGPYQPYLVWVPAELAVPTPLVVFLHGFQQNHLANAGFFAADGVPTQGRFDLDAPVVMPLGRAGTSFYMGPGEQDVLDVVADASARYGVDPDRVVLSGLSMGGFGDFKLGLRYPDMWSAVVSYIGTGASAQSTFPLPREVLDPLFSPAGFPGGQAELMENFRNVPLRLVNGQVDPIVNTGFSTLDVARLQLLGLDHHAWVLLRRHHEVPAAVAGCVLEEAVGARRVAAPARITYRTAPAMFVDDPDSGLLLRYEGAWWVSRMLVRDGTAEGGVDVTSLARADRDVFATSFHGFGENALAGRTLCGPDPSVMTNDAWREHGVRLRPAPPAPVSNGVRLVVDGLDRVQLDLDAADVDPSRALAIEVRGDGPIRLELATDGWPGSVDVSIDGAAPLTTTPVDGVVVIEADLTGAHHVVVDP